MEFLTACDLVKFARFQPGQSQLMSLHGSALQLVNETEPTPASVATQPPAPAVTA